MFERTWCSALLLASAMGAAGAGHALEDPTRPLRAGAAPAAAPVDRGPAAPTLESVLIGPNRRLAVIDGHRMMEGEERHGLKVWKIRADGVVVSVNGSRMTLEMTSARMHKELR